MTDPIIMATCNGVTVSGGHIVHHSDCPMHGPWMLSGLRGPDPRGYPDLLAAKEIGRQEGLAEGRRLQLADDMAALQDGDRFLAWARARAETNGWNHFPNATPGAIHAPEYLASLAPNDTEGGRSA